MSSTTRGALLQRHKLVVMGGLLGAVLLGALAGYRIDGDRLISREPPVYETTAVVAVKPGTEVVTAVGDAGDVPAPLAVTSSAVPIDNVIDSEALQYAALSITTIVVSPGFSQTVGSRVPLMDGSVTGLATPDTNTISIVVDASSPSIATDTMSVALAELDDVVASYASSPVFRFTLQNVIVSAPSTPARVRTMTAPLTSVLTFAVVVAAGWLILRAVDTRQQRRSRSRRAEQAAPTDARALVEGELVDAAA